MKNIPIIYAEITPVRNKTAALQIIQITYPWPYSYMLAWWWMGGDEQAAHSTQWWRTGLLFLRMGADRAWRSCTVPNWPASGRRPWMTKQRGDELAYILLRDRSLNMGGGGAGGFRQIFREKTSGPPFKLSDKFSGPPFRPRDKIGSPPFFSNISLHAIWL